MDSKVIKNHILLATVKRLGIPYRLKKNLYLLVTILGDLIFYRNGVIRIEIKLLKLKIKGQKIVINFNILLLKSDKTVLKMS